MSYIVYILKSDRDGSLYVGQTCDLTRRLFQHNDVSGTGFTSSLGPWEVIYTETHRTRSDAVRRERYLKSPDGSQDRKWLAESSA